MSYTRKTIDEFDIEVDYGQGFEIVCCEPTRQEAQIRKREYLENEPGYPVRIYHHMVKKQ